MGSVPDLYTTGDNDPEIEPVSYLRHYLYCDACGSFDLGPWQSEGSDAAERRRDRLAAVALYGSPLLVVPVWRALQLPSLMLPLALVAGITAVLLFWTYQRKLRHRPDAPQAGLARFLGRTLRWLVIVGVTELLTEGLPASIVLTIGAVLVGGALVWRATLGSRTESMGMRCRGCGATYAWGTPFFTDLAANPRNLGVSEVPRPLGSTPFQRGAPVDAGPAPAPGLPARPPASTPGTPDTTSSEGPAPP